MKLLVIVALATRAAMADPAPRPADLTPSLVGPPSIGLIMEPPAVDAQMVIVPPPVDRDMALGPAAHDFFGMFHDVLVEAMGWLVPATL